MMLSNAWGPITVTFCPKVSLSESFTIKATAAMAFKHESHPLATGSSFLTNKPRAVSTAHGPRTPLATPALSSTYRVNGLVGSGRVRARASNKALFILSKASWCLGVHTKSPVSLVNGYRGAAKEGNPGIHSQQNPAVPRNSLTCRGLEGTGI